MDFDRIEKLSENEVANLYEDIIENAGNDNFVWCGCKGAPLPPAGCPYSFHDAFCWPDSTSRSWVNTSGCPSKCTNLGLSVWGNSTSRENDAQIPTYYGLCSSHFNRYCEIYNSSCTADGSYCRH